MTQDDRRRMKAALRVIAGDITPSNLDDIGLQRIAWVWNDGDKEDILERAVFVVIEIIDQLETP